MNAEKTPTKADKLALALKPLLPAGFECYPHFDRMSFSSPEIVVICPKREIYRERRLNKTCQLLDDLAKQFASRLVLAGFTLGLEKCWICVNPEQAGNLGSQF